MLSISDLRRISSAYHRKSAKISSKEPRPLAVIGNLDQALLSSRLTEDAREIELGDAVFDSGKTECHAGFTREANAEPKREITELETTEDMSLSSPNFLQKVFDTTSSREFEDDTTKTEDEEISIEDILLYYPVYNRYLRLLPMKDLLSLSKVSRSLHALGEEEKYRPGRLRCEYIYRKNFIRHFNLSYGTAKFIPQEKIYTSLLKDLFIIPEHVMIFYSPDTFHYDVRYLDKNGNPQVGKFDELLNYMMNKEDDEELRVWHMRLFSVLQPFSHQAPHVEDSSRLSRNELNRMFLWHSEDLAMVVLPSLHNVQIVHRYINYSNFFGTSFSVRDRGRNLFPLVALIEKKYSPKLLLMSVRDLPSSIEGLDYGYPIVISETQIFDRMAPEEWMIFSGSVSVYQVILDMSDSREERDEKIRALRFQVGNSVKPRQGFIFYHTEMWPGGTSKEIPQCDMILLRKVFPGVPVLGGRAKKIMGNQYLPLLNDSSSLNANTLLLRPTVTIVTALGFP